jgi:hypothetical protein
MELGLQGLACLASSSRTLRDASKNAATTEALSLSNVELGHKKAAAVVWLLQQAPSQAPAISAKLFTLPVESLEGAKELVSAGVRITYAQLLAAANSMVKGLELWVQAQQHLQVKTDIPPLAVAICCERQWVSAWCFRTESP